MAVGGCADPVVSDNEIDGQQWSLFVRGLRPPTGQRAALIEGTVELDGESGCIYLQFEPGFVLPVVWPAGTEWADPGKSLVLADGRALVSGSFVRGGGGYEYAADLVERCPGRNNQYDEVAVFDSSAAELVVEMPDDP